MEAKKLFVVVGTDARQAAAGRVLERAGYAVGGAEQVALADYILLPLPLDAARTPLAELLRAAKPDSIPLDYPRLAVDLYGLQCDAPQLVQLPANIRLRWGQDLYRYEKNESSETQEKEN